MMEIKQNNAKLFLKKKKKILNGEGCWGGKIEENMGRDDQVWKMSEISAKRNSHGQIQTDFLVVQNRPIR